MPLELHYRGGAQVPLEVEGVLPAATRSLSLVEIARLPVFHGNRTCELGDFFDLRGTPDDEHHWHGDLSGVHWLGAKLKEGRIVVHGDAGRHVGSEQRGGEILVDGSVGDWLGAELHGGLIRVHGRAGHLVGAAYRGSAKGMTGGTILVEGEVGNEVGHSLRRGLIVVGGPMGDLAGFNMLAGTIVALGTTGIRHGAGMRRGTLLFAAERPPLLPTFRRGCRYRPPFLPLLWGLLRRQDFPWDPSLAESDWELFHGDLITGGRGEILCRAA